MSYAIECYFDLKSAQEIDKLRSVFTKNSINIDDNCRPHISLAIYENLKLGMFIEQLELFSLNSEKIEFNLTDFGIFPTEGAGV